MQPGREAARGGGMVALLLLYFAAASPAQDLGEAARQQKLKKATSPSTERHVITNEDIPSAKASTAASPQKPGKGRADPAGKTSASKPEKKEDSKPSAEDVREAIRAQKQNVSSAEAETKQMEKRLNELDGALKRAFKEGGDCRTVFLIGAGRENVCGLPEKLLAEKSRLRSVLEQERKTLEEMQEEARRMGYGNTVYEPD